MLFIFDMGGVVTNTARPEGFIARELNVSVEDFRAAQNQGGKNLFAELTCGRITEREFWEKAGDALGKKIDTPWWEFFFHPELDRESAVLIRELKEAGHRVVCGTNTIWAHYYNHLSRGDYALFDQTYASQQMGVMKPDTRFWELILLSEGYEARDAFFTDDRKENVEAAARLGINAVLWTGAKALRKEWKSFIV